jgi:hypothetical protein
MTTAMTSALAIVGVLIWTAPALAQAPVALVEALRGSPEGVEFMDYVTVGKMVRLSPQDSIVLGYLTSCWHESITGGTVIVGSEQSDVRGGKVTRTKVLCDGGRISLTAGQADQSAGTSYRSLDQESPTLYGLYPVVEAPSGSALAIVRIDREGELHVATMPVKKGKQRSFLDFATAKKRLTAGGIYRASIGARQIVFKVDPGAKILGVPIISRLLRFPAGRSANH